MGKMLPHGGGRPEREISSPRTINQTPPDGLAPTGSASLPTSEIHARSVADGTISDIPTGRQIRRIPQATLPDTTSRDATVSHTAEPGSAIQRRIQPTDSGTVTDVKKPEQTGVAERAPLPGPDKLNNPWEGQDAWADLHAAMEPDLMRQALALVPGDHQAAEDLVQVAFAKLAAKIQSGADIRDLAAYTNRILHTTAIDEARRGSGEQVLSLDAPTKLGDEPLGETLADTEDTETHAVSSVTEQSLINLLRDAISPEQLRVLYLSASGLTPKQIADQLDIPQATARSTLSRARTKAAEVLRPHIEDNVEDRSLKWGGNTTLQEYNAPTASAPTWKEQLSAAILAAHQPGVDTKAALAEIRRRYVHVSPSTISKIKTELRDDGYNIANGREHPNIQALRDIILAANQSGATSRQITAIINDAQKAAGVSYQAVSRLKRLLRDDGHNII